MQKHTHVSYTDLWDFPGSPVVKTPCFHCRGLGFDPWPGGAYRQGRSHMPGGTAKNKDYADFFSSFIFIVAIKFKFIWFKIQRVQKGTLSFSHLCPQAPSSPSHEYQFWVSSPILWVYLYRNTFDFTIIDR